MHVGEELFSARMAYEAWVAPSLEAAGCVAPRFCGVGTDRSPLIIDAARDVAQLVESEVTPGWRHSLAALLVAPQLGCQASLDGAVGCRVAPRTQKKSRPDLHKGLWCHRHRLPKLEVVHR